MSKFQNFFFFLDYLFATKYFVCYFWIIVGLFSIVFGLLLNILLFLVLPDILDYCVFVICYKLFVMLLVKYCYLLPKFSFHFCYFIL